MVRTILMEDCRRIAADLEGRPYERRQQVVHCDTYSGLKSGCGVFEGDVQCCAPVVEELVFHGNSEPDWGLPVCAGHLAKNHAEQLLATLDSSGEKQ